jgi:ATP-dependent Clp protease adaptor protein ClpS
MSKQATAIQEDVVAETGTKQAERQAAEKDARRRPKRQPRYNVILWDDDDHSYDYVIRMMKELFGHSYEKGYLMACEVDRSGRTICLTTTMEHAELKRDQVHAFGRDRLIASSAGSMSCTIEPIE